MIRRRRRKVYNIVAVGQEDDELEMNTEWETAMGWGGAFGGGCGEGSG